MAVYLVKGPEGTKPRLVSTRTKVAAIQHVSQGMFSADPVNTKELVQHIKAGLEVEEIEAKAKKGAGEEVPGTQPLPLEGGQTQTEAANAEASAEEKPAEDASEKIPGFARRRR